MMHALDILTYAAFVCALISLPFFIVNFLRFRSKVLADRSLLPSRLKAPYPVKSIIAFISSIATGIIAVELSTQIARTDVLRDLSSLSADCRVSIAGRPVTDPQSLVQVLRSLRWAPAHHSHPSHPISVLLVDPSHAVELTVSRDSSNPHEYWVFLPRYHVTSLNEIGRIFTDKFDAY